jgi:hypothetical protein
MDEEEIEGKEDEVNCYERKMPMRQILEELERDGIIEIYEDQWGEVQVRITGAWT